MLRPGWSYDVLPWKPMPVGGISRGRTKTIFQFTAGRAIDEESLVLVSETRAIVAMVDIRAER